MGQTKYFGMDYPDENQDPYFDRIQAFFMTLDENFFALKALRDPLLGGGFLNFVNLTVFPQPFTAQFTWTQDFEFIVPGSGFSFFIKFGPDQLTRSILLNDGDRVIVTVPFISSENIIANFSVINGAITSKAQQGLYTLGIYRAGVFYTNLPRTFP